MIHSKNAVEGKYLQFFEEGGFWEYWFISILNLNVHVTPKIMNITTTRHLHFHIFLHFPIVYAEIWREAFLFAGLHNVIHLEQTQYKKWAMKQSSVFGRGEMSSVKLEKKSSSFYLHFVLDSKKVCCLFKNSK